MLTALPSLETHILSSSTLWNPSAWVVHCAHSPVGLPQHRAAWTSLRSCAAGREFGRSVLLRNSRPCP